MTNRLTSQMSKTTPIPEFLTAIPATEIANMPNKTDKKDPMSAKDRAALILKLYKACKKHYGFIQPPSDRRVLEHMLYACCLEDSTYESADEAFACLQQNYFDWNEVRVTTASELAWSAKT